MVTVIFLGRIIFGAFFVYSGIMHFKEEKAMVGYAKSKQVPSPRIAVLLSGAMMIAGGALIFFNLMVSKGALLVLLTLIPITFMIHNFWKEKSKPEKLVEMNAFIKNLALIGALLMLF